MTRCGHNAQDAGSVGVLPLEIIVVDRQSTLRGVLVAFARRASPSFKKGGQPPWRTKMKMAKCTIIFAAVLAVLSVAASAASFNQKGASAITPIELTTDGPTQGKTDQGDDFTSTTWSGSLPNTDAYVVGIGEYSYQLNSVDLPRFAEAFAAGAHGIVIHSTEITVSGLPAIIQVVSVESENHTIRICWLGVFKGNKAYQFFFGSNIDVQSDEAAFKTFFNSIAIN